MEKHDALAACGALSQETRMDVFRILVKAGDAGMQAGEVGDALGVKSNTLSANLSVLLAAGLVRNERQGRFIRYYADMDGMRGLLGFLMEDCCGGRPEACRPILDAIAC